MCLVSLDDPGLTVFATTGCSAASRRLGKAGGPCQSASRELRDRGGRRGRARPCGRGRTSACSATSTRISARAFACRLKDDVDLALLMPGRSSAYRDLDAAILEKVVLEGALGMTPEDVEAKRGHRVCEERCGGGRRARRGLRRGLPAAPDADRTGPRRRRRGRDHAPEVDLLLPEAPHGNRLQPAQLTAEH